MGYECLQITPVSHIPEVHNPRISAKKMAVDKIVSVFWDSPDKVWRIDFPDPELTNGEIESFAACMRNGVTCIRYPSYWARVARRGRSIYLERTPDRNRRSG
jgi:hypothetical protein